MSVSKKIFWLSGIVALSLSGIAVGQESAQSNDISAFRERVVDILVDDEVSVFTRYPEVKDGGHSLMAKKFLEKYKDLQDVSVTTLDKAYNQNEIKADLQYKDKMLIVTGKVASIDKSFGSPVLQLRTNNPYLSVNAFFKKQKSDSNELELTLAEFKKGQPVSLICRGGGKVMVPVLRDCELLNPLIKKEGEALRKEWLEALTKKSDSEDDVAMALFVFYFEESIGSQGQATCLKSKANCTKLLEKTSAKIRKTKKEDIKLPQAFLDLGYTPNKGEEKKEDTSAK